eukprot:SAG11_NODE_22450_length_405_cov_19.771242_1_plen_84_part_00
MTLGKKVTAIKLIEGPKFPAAWIASGHAHFCHACGGLNPRTYVSKTEESKAAREVLLYVRARVQSNVGTRTILISTTERFISF